MKYVLFLLILLSSCSGESSTENKPNRSPVGLWTFEQENLVWTKEIYSNGTTISDGPGGGSSVGRWDGDENEIRFISDGIVKAQGYVSSDGMTMTVNTYGGTLEFERQR